MSSPQRLPSGLRWAVPNAPHRPPSQATSLSASTNAKSSLLPPPLPNPPVRHSSPPSRAPLTPSQPASNSPLTHSPRPSQPPRPLSPPSSLPVPSPNLLPTLAPPQSPALTARCSPPSNPPKNLVLKRAAIDPRAIRVPRRIVRMRDLYRWRGRRRRRVGSLGSERGVRIRLRKVSSVCRGWERG